MLGIVAEVSCVINARRLFIKYVLAAKCEYRLGVTEVEVVVVAEVNRSPVTNATLESKRLS